MIKRPSIRLRLIDGLQRVADQVSKHLMQELRRSKVHPHAGSNLRNGIVIGVGNGRCERQADDAISMASLGQKVNELDGSTVIPNFITIASNRQSAAAANNHLISHQKSPIGKNYLANLSEQCAGVESPSQEAI